MPRRLKDFSYSDWVRLRPLTESLKVARLQRINRRYCQRRLTMGDITSIGRGLHDRRVLITIAFNDPEAIALQVRMLKQTVDNFVHLIADNSSDEARADEIDAIAHAEQVLYVRLPPNPWQGRRHASRSHGQAMNWIWHQLLLPNQPAQFGFLDHDLFPTRPCDPFMALQNLPFYGDKRRAGERWFLWAGYCFFCFSRVAHLPLDFGQDWFLGLDTGGANWETLYSNFDAKLLPNRRIYETEILPNVPKAEAYVEWRDDWLHEVGLAGDVRWRSAKREAVKRMLEDIAHQGAVRMV